MFRQGESAATLGKSVLTRPLWKRTLESDCTKSSRRHCAPLNQRLRKILESRADPSAADYDKRTPLHVACSQKKSEAGVLTGG